LITEDQAHIEVDLTDGRTLTRFVEQSLGNLKRPLSDAQLESKFRDQGVLALPAAQIESLVELCWRIDELDDVRELVQAAVPAPQTVP
jgi:2-methylcitrate dehydratase PrpD